MTKGFSPVTFKLLTFSFLAFLLITANPTNVLASDGGQEGEEFNPVEMINHHILDSHEWHFFDGATLYLPVILYSSDRGIEVFMSSNFHDEHHNLKEYKGYKYEHGHIVPEAGRSVIDFSITKNVAFLFINAGLLLLVFLAVAKGYKKNQGQAPKGIQSFFEPIIIFVRDEIVIPNIGEKKHEKFLPYLLTLFFFIWFGNLLGLLPGAANLTGNIAVTIVLALFTFVVTNVNGNKDYWKHVFNTPGVPFALKFIIVPVEFIGLFTKPFSLLIRLFVAITAGHIVILSLIGLVFIFQSYAVGVASTVIVTFINFIELLVATIQAYVFTMFSSLYIGLAVADHDDHH